MLTRFGPEIIRYYWEDNLLAPGGVPRKSFFVRNNDNLDQKLQRFWKIEKLPNETWTTEEILCE
jgi:hypothetical protein